MYITKFTALSMFLILVVCLIINPILQDKEVNNLRKVIKSKSDLINIQQDMLHTYSIMLKVQNEKIDRLEQLLDTPITDKLEYVNSDAFIVTAYAPYDDMNGLNSDGSPDTTATGTKPRPGTFAVDPKVIPYGSTVIITYTDGTIERGVAEDTGGMIKGNRIDVFRYKFSTAMDFGKKTATVMWFREED